MDQLAKAHQKIMKDLAYELQYREMFTKKELRESHQIREIMNETFFFDFIQEIKNMINDISQ